MTGKVHKCEVLAAKIKNMYVNARAGARLPSIRKVAMKSGCSSQVVSQAYKVLCEQGFCTASARSGVYWNALPPERQNQKKYRIGCTLNATRRKDENPKHLRMVQNFDHYAWCMLKDMGHELFFFDSERLSKGIVEDSMLNEIDGWLISCMDFDVSKKPEWMQFPPRPTVLFRYQQIVNYPVSQVLPDHYSGIREMFREAKDFDLKGVTIVTPEFASCIARGRICAEVAAENHLEVKDFIIKPVSCNFMELGRKLAGDVKGHLVFCCSDLPAFELYQGICQKGLLPCKDFHFVGDDDVEGLGVYPLEIPTLSEITYSRKKQTELAVNLLLQSIRTPSDVTHIELVPTHFVRRLSGLRKLEEKEKEKGHLQNQR